MLFALFSLLFFVNMVLGRAIDISTIATADDAAFVMPVPAIVMIVFTFVLLVAFGVAAYYVESPSRCLVVLKERFMVLTSVPACFQAAKNLPHRFYGTIYACFTIQSKKARFKVVDTFGKVRCAIWNFLSKYHICYPKLQEDKNHWPALCPPHQFPTAPKFEGPTPDLEAPVIDSRWARLQNYWSKIFRDFRTWYDGEILPVVYMEPSDPWRKYDNFGRLRAPGTYKEETEDEYLREICYFVGKPSNHALGIVDGESAEQQVEDGRASTSSRTERVAEGSSLSSPSPVLLAGPIVTGSLPSPPPDSPISRSEVDIKSSPSRMGLFSDCPTPGRRTPPIAKSHARSSSPRSGGLRPLSLCATYGLPTPPPTPSAASPPSPPAFEVPSMPAIPAPSKRVPLVGRKRVGPETPRPYSQVIMTPVSPLISSISSSDRYKEINHIYSRSSFSDLCARESAVCALV